MQTGMDKYSRVKLNFISSQQLDLNENVVLKSLFPSIFDTLKSIQNNKFTFNHCQKSAKVTLLTI